MVTFIEINMKRNLIFTLLFACSITFNSIAQIAYSVDIFPNNVGGKSEFKRVFEQELIYPADALKKKIGGKVTINFVVMKDSSVSNITVVGSGFPDLDKEAMRLFKLYQWVPGIKDSQYISAYWSVVFDFNPDKYSKICRQRGFVNVEYVKDATIDTTGKIYTAPEQFPMYPKGNYALQDFIKENLEYPRQAQLSNLQGTVILSFIVEPSGLITNIGIDNSVGGGCDQEAIRILELIKWYPGKHQDKLVRAKMTFPFYFILNEDFKDNSSSEQK